MESVTGVASEFSGAAFVCGPAVPDWRKADLAKSPVTLFVDGKVVAEGKGEEAGGHPILPLVWLANDRRKRGDGLKAGMFISTSSCTGVYRCASPAVAVADYGPFGKVQVTFT